MVKKMYLAPIRETLFWEQGLFEYHVIYLSVLVNSFDLLWPEIQK